MIPRTQLERELDHLQSMLPPWREKLRHEAQFWPQFDVLADRLVDSAKEDDKAFALQRIARMLAQEGLVRPPVTEVEPRASRT